MSSNERTQAVKAEQEGMSREEIASDMERRSEHTLDLNNLPTQKHYWVDRGLKLSCEGAGHPHHSHFKVKR